MIKESDDTLTKLYQKGYQQGRADAIDEFAHLLKTNYDVYSGGCSCRHSVSIDKVFEIAKQLKEKNE